MKDEVMEQILFDEKEQVNVTDDGIQSISVLAETQLDLEGQMEEKENELKVLKEKHRRISQDPG